MDFNTSDSLYGYDLHDNYENNYDHDNTYSTNLFGAKTRSIINQHTWGKPLFVYHAWNGVHADVSLPDWDEYGRRFVFLILSCVYVVASRNCLTCVTGLDDAQLATSLCVVTD